MKNYYQKSIVILAIIAIGFGFGGSLAAQSSLEKRHYLGFLPSVLWEPYDSVNAVEINLIPLVYEYQWSTHWSIQFRPIFNYRFHERSRGIAQIGAGVHGQRYFNEWSMSQGTLIPNANVFLTYAQHQIDQVHTVTLGAEFGLHFIFSDRWSLSTNLQPGANYYPDSHSRDFTDTQNGWKAHFGIIAHIGYRWGRS